MIRFKRDNFELEFLDPVADRRLLGDRFCRGASLWQLRDGQGRELLSGPEYPNPAPDPFNNQGFPEVFRSRDKFSGELLNFDSRGTGLIIGVGRASVQDDGSPVVDRPCDWEFSDHGDDLIWRTRDSSGDWSYELERRWTITGQSITSSTKVLNRGEADLDVHWYPHPFFPLCIGGTAFSVVPEVEADLSSGGFKRTAVGYRTTAACENETGCFEWLNADYGESLKWVVEHPLCGKISVKGNFPAAYMAVWSNRNTISLEPYVLCTLREEEETFWDITYTFGP